MTTRQLFDTFCVGESYDAWRQVIGQLDDPPAAPSNLELWNRISGGRAPLSAPPSELYCAIGRGAAKTQTAAIIAVSKAIAYRKRRIFGQRPFVGLFARDQRQADEAMAYVRQLFEHATLRPLIASDPAKRVITLKTGVRIEVLPADFRKVRSRGYLCAVVDEAAFLDNGDSAALPDVELLRALRPALGRVPGSLLVVISSKHAQRGILFEASKLFGVNDPHTLYIEGGTLDFNPTFSAATIERAYREDPIAAASEYGTRWREDVVGFITPEAIAAVTTPGVIERPPAPDVTHRAFVDFAGGSGGDSAALGIAHTDRHAKREVLDLILEIRPPFSPADVCAQFAETLHRYAVQTITADRWGSQFVVEGMARHAIRVEQSARPKSELYLEGLPLIMSKLVDLLDVPRLATQLTGLDRSAGGTVDHRRGAHDDVANAAIGALVTGRTSQHTQYRARII